MAQQMRDPRPARDPTHRYAIYGGFPLFSPGQYSPGSSYASSELSSEDPDPRMTALARLEMSSTSQTGSEDAPESSRQAGIGQATESLTSPPPKPIIKPVDRPDPPSGDVPRLPMPSMSPVFGQQDMPSSPSAVFPATPASSLSRDYEPRSIALPRFPAPPGYSILNEEQPRSSVPTVSPVFPTSQLLSDPGFHAAGPPQYPMSLYSSAFSQPGSSSSTMPPLTAPSLVVPPPTMRQSTVPRLNMPQLTVSPISLSFSEPDLNLGSLGPLRAPPTASLFTNPTPPTSQPLLSHEADTPGHSSRPIYHVFAPGTNSDSERCGIPEDERAALHCCKCGRNRDIHTFNGEHILGYVYCACQHRPCVNCTVSGIVKVFQPDEEPCIVPVSAENNEIWYGVICRCCGLSWRAKEQRRQSKLLTKMPSFSMAQHHQKRLGACEKVNGKLRRVRSQLALTGKRLITPPGQSKPKEAEFATVNVTGFDCNCGQELDNQSLCFQVDGPPTKRAQVQPDSPLTKKHWWSTTPELKAFGHGKSLLSLAKGVKHVNPLRSNPISPDEVVEERRNWHQTRMH
ncbi:unnamed protein product [Periconia digitata]|uniref:Probable double zinc ribbon domain-containing protein n=1 Tax=Periconia digitata TaxID=1303443 RepID=A0A9W4UTF2_9PLEO|nr:unnamed protein product [Periconia digitata]